MPAYSSTISWVHAEVSVELPGVRWPWLVLVAGALLGGSLVLLGRRTPAWVAPAVGATLAVGIGVVAFLEIPSCDVLRAVPPARHAALLLFAARDLGAAAAAASFLTGLTALASRRHRLAAHEAIACALGFAAGVAVAWAQSEPIARLTDDVLSVGRLPAPVFLHSVSAHVGLPVERVPSVVHRLLEDTPVTRFHDGWELDRPRRIVPAVAGFGSVKVEYALGPVRITVPQDVRGVEDRGPRAWPLAIGDELRLREGEADGPTTVIRVRGTQVVNGFNAYVTEVVRGGESPRTEHIVRKDGGLYRATPGKNEHDGDLALEELLVERTPGKCTFDGLECACEPKLLKCSVTSEATSLGHLARFLIVAASLGTASDIALGRTTTREVFVVSHTGPGAPR